MKDEGNQQPSVMNTRDSRTCKKCGIAKAIAAFPMYDAKRYRHECRDCNKQRVESWHREHKDERLAKAKARYALNPAAVWTPERRARANDLAKARTIALRAQVYAQLGLSCACCGETEPTFLTIDHVENDGAKMRKIHGTGTNFYRWLLKHRPTTGFQVLCMNCNFGKARNGGVCIHSEGSTTRAKARTAKRPEAPDTLRGEDIVCSASKDAAVAYG